MIAGITVYWKKFRAKQRAGEKFSEKLPLNEDESTVFTPDESMGFTPDESMVFTLHQIVEATQNFSHQIGSGGSGTVFLGKLPDAKEIAIKRFSLNRRDRFQEFLTEVDLLSRAHHKNLVPLLGYCFAKSEQPMVIYEYMSQGSLKDHLYGEKAGLFKLNWKSRLKIAIDVAEALQYLHVCCTPMIIHRDVKTANILLDSDFNGKLSDFGMSMMTMDRKAIFEDDVKGTFGYMAPEYVMTGKFTQKSDVFGFGVVLLEIICGRKPHEFDSDDSDNDDIVPFTRDSGNDDSDNDDIVPFRRDSDNDDNDNDDIVLFKRVKDCVATPGKMVKIIDKNMDGKYDMKSITIVAKLALRCVEQTSSRRPSMSEVVGQLKEAFMYEKVRLSAMSSWVSFS